MSGCAPSRWIGLGFVATTVNAPPDVLVGIEGIEAAAIQVAWGTTPNLLSLSPRERGQRGRLQSSSTVTGWIADAHAVGLEPAGWAWCDAHDVDGAALEGATHARLVLELGLDLFVANMEESYDAHSDTSSPRFHMPDAYLEAFRGIAPDVELAVTTTPRWASNHEAVRAAGAVLMGQAFSLEVPSPPGPATVEACVAFGKSWGWEPRYLRPLVQVYETNGQVPGAAPYLEESAEAGVGVVPYILEQAFGGQGRELLSALVPAIERAPARVPIPPNGGGDDVQTIGSQHGVTASVNRMRTLDPGGTLLVADASGKWPPLSSLTAPVKDWRAYDKLERSLTILVEDHDELATSYGSGEPTDSGE